ncbi:hypothetical protein [Pseudomonas putida]|uniref:hypothetical protein n=1 Tax=Pseudomonas putida TaxID=303 RepID=UPI001F518C66|nr:hypothetical protein [Pseudomonas putida]
MTIDISKLKALATAAAANQYDVVALNDYGTEVPPATVLGLIAEIEHHRQINAEGCKPDSNILPSSVPCAGAAPCRSLDKAKGGTPDLKSPIHPDDMARITKWHSKFLKLIDYAWPDDISLLQDEAYALGRIRGQNDKLAEQRQVTAALREDIERGSRIQLAMALDLTAIAQALGIPTEAQETGAAESIAAIQELRDRLWNRDALLGDLLDHCISNRARQRINQAMLSEDDPCSLSKGALHVLAEQRTQIVVEGWTPGHDDAHMSGEIAQAAADYAMPGQHPVPGVGWASKKSELPRRLQLVRAGALILAEIARLDRQLAREALV